MYFEKTPFGQADEILKTKDSLAIEIEEILHELNTVITWHGQTRLNQDLDELFERRRDRGWESQVDSLLKLETEKERSGPKSIDYRNTKYKVDIEAEFGNVASIYRDIFKFNISKKADQIDIGIIITGDKDIANAVGENVASYERFRDELRISWKYRANANCPVMLYGILPLRFPDKKYLIDKNAIIKKKELQAKRKQRDTQKKEQERMRDQKRLI